MNVLKKIDTRARGTMIKAACRFGLATNPRSVDIAGETVQFYVTTPKERFRATDAVEDERPYLELFLKEISPGDVVWDVGSCTGLYTVTAASKGASVLAFEPFKANADRTQDHIDLNGVSSLAEVCNVALGKEKTTAKIDANQLGDGNNRLSDIGEVVNVIRGDSVDSSPDVVKIDVEGAEIDVLEGMDNLLSEVRYLSLECHRQYGVDPDDAEMMLTKYGFEVEQIGSRRDESFLVARRTE